MKNSESFTDLLKSATESVKRKAHRKKVPIAISENGCIKLIYPDNKVKVARKASRGIEKP